MAIRIGGMASGMDIDSMVRDLMKVERIPFDRLGQKKQILEWQRDDYRAMSASLYDLDQSIFYGINKQRTFSEKIMSSSNEGAVVAKSINATSNINTSIRVDQLAEAAYMNSGDIRVDTTKTINQDNLLSSEITAGNIKSFTATEFTIQAIKSDGTLGDAVTIKVDPATDSLNDVIDDINNSAAGVNAFYDSQTGRISITAKNTGDVAGDAEIKLTTVNGTGTFLNMLNIGSDNITAATNGTGIAGKDAKFNINGINTTRSSNTFQIGGYEYTLKSVTGDGDLITETGELVNITSRTDTDAIYKSIEDFVKKYNEVIGKINGEISEERYRSYSPLTQDQRSGLSDKEVELWEEKARSGLISNDFMLKSGLTTMREDLYTPITGLNSSFDHVGDIGIATSTYKDAGKLIIDEEKLRAAIEKDPNAVYDIFNKKTVDANNNVIKSESGIAIRLRESLSDTMENIKLKAGNAASPASTYSIGVNITDLQRKMIDLERNLLVMENQYWKEFTAMEKAIQDSNSQMAYLGQQFANM